MDEDPMAVVQRWEDAGGHWRVISRRTEAGTATVTVGLYRCDGGEEMDRVQSSDRRLIDFLGSRDRSDA